MQKDNPINSQIRSLLNLSSNKVQNISREQISPFIICRTEDSESDHRLCSNSSCRNRMSPNVMKAMENKRITQKDQLKQSQKQIESKRSQDNLILSLEDISEFSDSEKKKEEEESDSCSARDQSEKGCEYDDNRCSQKQSPSLLSFSLQPISNELQRKHENVLLLSPKPEIQVFIFGEGEVIGDERILCQCNNTVRFKVKCTSIEGGQLLQAPRSMIEYHKTPDESDTKNLLAAQKLLQQKKLARYNKESFPKGIPNSPQFTLQKNCLPMIKVLGPSEMSQKVSAIRSPSLSQQYSRSETNLKCYSDELKKQDSPEQSYCSNLLKCCKAQFHPVGMKPKEVQACVENEPLSRNQEQNDRKDSKDTNQKLDGYGNIINEQEKDLKQPVARNKDSLDVKEEIIAKPSFFNEQKREKINISAKKEEKYPNSIKHPLLKSPLQIPHQFSPASLHYPIHQNQASDCLSSSQTPHTSLKTYLNSHTFFNQKIQTSSKSQKSINDMIKCKSQDNINSKSLNQQQLSHKSLLTNDLRISLNFKSSGDQQQQQQHLLGASSNSIQQRSCTKQSNDSKLEFNFNESLSSSTKRNEWKQLFSPGYRSHPEFSLHDVSEVHRPVSVCLSSSTGAKKDAIPPIRRYSDQEEEQGQHKSFEHNAETALKCKKILVFQDNQNNPNQRQDSRQQIVSRVRSLGWINMEEMIENNENREKCVSMQETGNPMSIAEHPAITTLENEIDCYNYRTDNSFPKSAKSCEKDRKITKDYREIKSSSGNKSLKVHFNWNQQEICDTDDAASAYQIKETISNNDKSSKIISPELKAKCLYLCGNNQIQDTQSSIVPSSSSNLVSLGVIECGSIPKITQHSQQLTLKDLQESISSQVSMIKAPTNNHTSSSKIPPEFAKTTNPINRIFKQSVS